MSRWLFYIQFCSLSPHLFYATSSSIICGNFYQKVVPGNPTVRTCPWSGVEGAAHPDSTRVNRVAFSTSAALSIILNSAAMVRVLALARLAMHLIHWTPCWKSRSMAYSIGNLRD
ncbi:hypothetical protein BRADI_1g78775v3 [Brachypodium distachyon]|uniref:Secreted protein n=1 Tax=Brachypodium distachyon TaxID=15368 RepID=A0A2K2DVW1_BRADI|nr:hypothetical protein BRADI_1g78775v3 [Brachypodium distachyon]